MTSDEFDKAVIVGALKAATIMLEEFFAKGSPLGNKPELDPYLDGFANVLEFDKTAPNEKWVGLTEEEKLIVNQMWDMVGVDVSIKLIEAKLKEKNS